MKSADGPLGGPIIPFHPPVPWFIIGVFCGIVPLRVPPKNRKFGLFSLTGRETILMRTEMLSLPHRKWLRISFLVRGMPWVVYLFVCVCARARMHTELVGRKRKHLACQCVCVPARINVPVSILCKYILCSAARVTLTWRVMFDEQHHDEISACT